MKTEFEKLLLENLKRRNKPGYYDPEYHISTYSKGIKMGEYRNPETQLCWEWYQLGKIVNQY